MIRVLLAILFLSPTLSFAISKEMQELMRDVSMLQEQVRNLQRSQDEKITEINVLVKQALDISRQTGNSLAALESGIRDRLREQEKSVVGPVAGVGAKVDQMAGEFAGVRESIADLTSRMSKMQQQLIDL